MRNPLRNLVARPSDKPSLRDRLAATRERWRRRPAAVASPELAGLIAEAERLMAAVRVGSDEDNWPDPGLVRQSVEARAAVVRFSSAGASDTGAKLASLGRTWVLSDIREEVQGSLSNGDATYEDLALTIIAELLEMGGIGPATALPLAARPDPIFAAIAEADRLVRISDEAHKIPDPGLDPLPAKVEALDAVHAHLRGVLLNIVPTTAAGCVALARFAFAYRQSQGVPVHDDERAILSLIARSPAL